MNKKLSKRKLKSYKRAELVCRELRHQLEHTSYWDGNTLCKYLQKWMQVTGDVKYVRPHDR